MIPRRRGTVQAARTSLTVAVHIPGMDTLTLPEELFLLSIHDAKGEVCETAQRSLPYGLAGAALADLALRRRDRKSTRRHYSHESPPRMQSSV